ncbi:MAG: metal ABC transporter substrate-binding protein [Janibacter sp.]
MPRTRPLVTACALLLTLTACGSGEDESGSDGRIQVATSFYPLEYAVEQVGGEHVDVTNLTKTGAEPHDLELTPKQILEVSEADHLMYLKQFQPSVDDAAQEAGDAAFDVTSAARLDIEADHGHEHEGEGGHEGHDHGSQDPHFWLDPTRYADVADAIAERLAEDDPDHAADYRANAKAFGSELTDLDKELKAGLSDCEQTDLVTGHAAFAYFTDRYGFHQESVSGLAPGAQPSPSAMADLVTHIKEEEISTVYAETLVPKDLAETIARDAGAKVLVLDPIEGITDASEGDDYFEVMRSNLDAVQQGQGCR